MTYASLKLKFHLGEKKTGFKLHIIMIRFILLIIIFCSCSMQKPVSMAHVERIEERVMPVAVGADTIEITEYRLQSANLTPSPAGLPLKQGENIASTTSVRSTRGVNISRHETETTSTLRITLRPDTVFVPYTHHIRSDTIVVPDRICKTKLQKTQTANVLLILIIIVATIIFFLKDRKT